MKCSEVQRSLILATKVKISSVPVGIVAKDEATGMILLRVKPTQFILNSNIVVDVLTRGDVFVVNMSKGTLFVMRGDRLVTPIVGELNWSEF